MPNHTTTFRIAVLLVSLLASLSQASTYTTAITGLSGVKRYFRLGETSAANGVANAIVDAIGAKNGTTANMINADFGQTGAILDDANNAIRFTTASNTIITLDNSDGAFTLANAGVAWWTVVWVKPTGTVSNELVFTTLNATPQGYEWFISYDAGTGTYYPRMNIQASNGELIMDGKLPNQTSTGYTIPRSDWSCIVAQYAPPASGSITGSHCKFWINGTPLVMTQSFTSGALTTAGTYGTPSPCLGSRGAGSAFPYSGNLDDVAFGTGNIMTDKIARDIYIAGIGTLQSRTKPTIILSTDCEQDVNSYVGEFGTAFGLVSNRLITLPNIDIVNALSGGSGTQEAKAVSMLATYHGVTPIISQNKTTFPTFTNTYTTTVVAGGFPFTIDSSNVAESVATLKAALNAAPDNSLIFVTMGQMTNLKNLLDDGAVTIALIRQKVQKLVCFGGEYINHTTFADPTGGNSGGAEFNFSTAAAHAAAVCANWPTTIEYLDFNLGTGSGLPGTQTFSNAADPKNAAYSASLTTGREDWGGVGWLHVVYNESGTAGGSGKLFATSATGVNVVNTATNTPNTGAAGYNKFTFGSTRNVTVSGSPVTLSDTYVTKVRAGNYSAWALRWMLETNPVTNTGPNKLGIGIGIGLSAVLPPTVPYANSDVIGRVGFRTTSRSGYLTAFGVTN